MAFIEAEAVISEEPLDGADLDRVGYAERER
jgi:hypothetical protein